MIPPLALYVHIPWCERKCPYCDFNSHVSSTIDEAGYVTQLVSEIQQFSDQNNSQPLRSIFFGGGTPSLFSAKSIGTILSAAERHLGFQHNCEITLEANPGSSEQTRFSGYKQAGVNRLSLGIQSFNDQHLKRLGRIHSSREAHNAIQAAQSAGISNINIDLMYALGEQTFEQAQQDIHTGLGYGTDHLSWYQLTIEQNTEYFKRPPKQPNDIVIETMEEQLRNYLEMNGLQRYEISAYSRNDNASAHNLNYWQFGDYLGIGAGAHSKITSGNQIKRIANTRSPKDYLARGQDKASQISTVTSEERIPEFMMNALRLKKGVRSELFEQRTGLALNTLQTKIEVLSSRGLMLPLDSGYISCTPKGYDLLNGVIEYFMD